MEYRFSLPETTLYQEQNMCTLWFLGGPRVGSVINTI